MALVQYDKSIDNFTRGRSSSCSSPIKNHIFYQEMFSVGSNTLVRSYSCNQIFNKNEAGQTFQTTQIHITSFITPKKGREKNEINSVEKIRYSSTGKNIKYICSKPETCRSRAKLKLDLNSSVGPIKRKKSIFRRSVIYGLLSTFIAVVAYICIAYRECHYMWDLVKLSTELQNSVFGQHDAIKKVNVILNLSKSSKELHSMVFTGGIGVGKTLTSSIISQNFPWNSKRLIFSKLLNSKTNDPMPHALSACGCNLIIVEDLTTKDISQAINFISLINTRIKNENVLLIIIFRVQNEVERNFIVSQFKSSWINFYHIPFKNLSEDIVEQCFKSEIQKQRVFISEPDLARLIANKLKPVGIVNGTVGCKGVADEVSLFAAKAHH